MDQASKFKGSIVKINDPSIVETQWRELEQRCSPSFFITWSWIGPWATLAEKNTELFLFSVRYNNTTIALCFFTLVEVKRLKGLIISKQVQINEFLSRKCNMVTQYNGMLVEDNKAGTAWSYFYDCLMNWDRVWDEVAISSASESTLNEIMSACPSLEQIIDKTHKAWNVPIDSECSDIDILLKRFKAKSRQQLRQSIKALEKELGTITYSIAANSEQAISYFNDMERLHTERWIKDSKSGSFANQNWVNFHNDVIKKGFPKGEVLLIAIKSGATYIGYLYGHIQNDTAFMQQTGFATMKKNSLRPGYVSHLYAMRYCAERGLHNYDFLPDDEESYKKFFVQPDESVCWARYQKQRVKFFIEKLARYFALYFQRK